MKKLLIASWVLIALAVLLPRTQAETINEGQIFPEFSTVNIDSLCIWDKLAFNHGRIILPMVTDSAMVATEGVRGEIMFNEHDEALYFCTTTGDPAVWVQIKDFS